MYIFVVEWSSSSVEPFETRVVVAGSVVKLDCTMDANCNNQSFRWTHYSAFNPRSETWYNGRRLDRMLMWRRVDVDKDTAMMTIPKARLTDGGIFKCMGLRNCQRNFQLIVTGNICVL